MMNTFKTPAVLIRAGRVVATACTSAESGATVSYGFTTSGSALVEVGKAKVSRAKRYLTTQATEGLEAALVNFGGGAAI
ncbi:hypothetical protein [Nevskia sp.]|uniref:hypothetical protein n=1 Tax=Nevskia sp. TaxID=1929292 RepID=UPI003F6E647D